MARPSDFNGTRIGPRMFHSDTAPTSLATGVASIMGSTSGATSLIAPAQIAPDVWIHIMAITMVLSSPSAAAQQWYGDCCAMLAAVGATAAIGIAEAPRGGSPNIPYSSAFPPIILSQELDLWLKLEALFQTGQPSAIFVDARVSVLQSTGGAVIETLLVGTYFDLWRESLNAPIPRA